MGCNTYMFLRIKINICVLNIFASCENEMPGTLNEPLQCQEVFDVCSKLKPGVSGVLIDYEHIRFGGPILWKLLHDLYQVFFDKSSVCKTLKTGFVLPFFKRKGAKANNKDNYRGVTLSRTLCKIYDKLIRKVCEPGWVSFGNAIWIPGRIRLY